MISIVAMSCVPGIRYALKELELREEYQRYLETHKEIMEGWRLLTFEEWKHRRRVD